MGVLDRNFGQTLSDAPDLVTSPGLAVASQGDSGTGQVLAQAQTAAATTQAVQEHVKDQGHGFFHSLSHALGHVAGDVGHWTMSGLSTLAKPLQEVQQDYRYLHAVYTHHGFFAGAAETLGVLGAGVGTAFLTGSPNAGILAADATASAEAHLLDPGLYNQVKDSKISFGRDVANLVGLHNTDHGWGKVVSGGLDLTSDFTFDPLVGAGKLAALRKSPEGLTQVRAYIAAKAAGRDTALTNFVDRFAPGTYISNPDSVERAYQAYAPVRRVITDLGRPEMDAGAVTAKYGKDLEGLAPDLGAATTPQEALNVFKRAASTRELTDRMTSAVMPSRSLLRASVNLTDRAKSYDGLGKGVIRTFTGYLPYTIDPGTLKLSKTTFNPDDTTGLHAIYRSLRFSLDEKAARDWTTKFATANTLGEKKAIYSNALMEMYKAAGLHDEQALVQKINDMTKWKVAGDSGNELYGRGFYNGESVSQVTHGGGTDQLGLHAFQAGHWSLPDFWELKKSVRDLKSYSKLYGKVDDFMAQHYTNNFFKPLALLNAGFGMRVAFAEAIPASFRYGTLNMARAAVDVAAAKERYRVANNIEKDGILAAAGRALHTHGLVAGTIAKLSDPTDEDAQLAMRMVMRGEGQTVRGVAATGHNDFATPDTPVENRKAQIQYLAQRKGLSRPDGNRWISLNTDAQRYDDYWLTGLQKRSQMVPAQLIAKDLQDHIAQGDDLKSAFDRAVEKERARIADLDGTAKDPYKAERDVLTRYTAQEPSEFATARVDDVLNHLAGADGTFHQDLATYMANGRKPTRDMIDQIDATQRPGAVVGHPDVPYLGDRLLQRVVQEGFKRVVDPWINHISREPMFFNATKQHYRQLIKAVDQHGSRLLTDDQALSLAQYRGALDMLPQIHNVALRSQAASLARNFLPFYFAQEQAVKRVGHLVAKNPAAFREYQLVQHGLHDPGFVQTDEQGNRHLMLPLVGEIGKGFTDGAAAMGIPILAGLPMAVAGNMESLKTVVPEANMPGVSPIGAIALKEIAQLFPEWTPSITKVAGAQAVGSSFKDELIPNNALRSLVHGMSADVQDRSFASAFASAVATAAYHGQLPPSDATPAQQQAFIDRIKNNTRSAFFMKAIMAAISPLAPNVQIEDAGLRDEFYNLTAKNDYPTAVQKFLAKHGSKAVSYTIAKSESQAGAALPGTQAAMDWINAHASLISNKDTAIGASFLVPQNKGAVDPAVYNEQLIMGLRARRTPETFRDQLYIQQGDQQFFDAFAVHKQALQNLASDKNAQDAENANWNDFVSKLKLSNRIWADHFDNNDDVNMAKTALSQLQKIYLNGQAPAGAQTEVVRNLLNAYNVHQNALASLADPSMAHDRALERDNWTAYLKQLRDSDPLAAPVIRSVFLKLEQRNG